MSGIFQNLARAVGHPFAAGSRGAWLSTMRNSLNPMVFIARAAAPTFSVAQGQQGSEENAKLSQYRKMTAPTLLRPPLKIQTALMTSKATLFRADLNPLDAVLNSFSFDKPIKLVFSHRKILSISQLTFVKNNVKLLLTIHAKR